MELIIKPVPIEDQPKNTSWAMPEWVYDLFQPKKK